MKSILSFFKKNLFFNLLLYCTLIVTSNSFSQSQYTGSHTGENLDFSGFLALFLGFCGVELAGVIVPLSLASPKAEIEIENSEILGNSDKLVEYKKPIKLSTDSGIKFGTIKSIKNNSMMLNEESDTIRLKDINSIMDLESAAGKDKVLRIKWSVFTISQGIAFSLIGIAMYPENKPINARTYLSFGISACLFCGSVLILNSSSDAEKEWEKYEQNKLGKSDDNGVKLSLGIGLLNLREVHTAANIVYTNIAPCITAKLSF